MMSDSSLDLDIEITYKIEAFVSKTDNWKSYFQVFFFCLFFFSFLIFKELSLNKLRF